MTDPIKNLADALRRIAAPTYGTEIHDTDADRADTYWRHLERLQGIAQGALAAYDAAQQKREEVARIVESGSLPSHLEQAEERDAAQAEPTCHLCNLPMPGGDTADHGLGECVPVCPTCDGSGTAQAEPSEYDALKHAMETLRGCVAPYSAEQAMRVAVVFRQWETKWRTLVDSLPAQAEPSDADIEAWKDRLLGLFEAIATLICNGDANVAVEECRKGLDIADEAVRLMRRGRK